MLEHIGKKRIWLLMLLAAVVMALPLFIARPYVDLSITFLVLTVGSASLRLLLLAGRLSLGQSSFMMVGGYAVGLLVTKLGLNPWTAIAAASIVTLVIAILFGLILLRLPGIYFVVATAALVLIGQSSMGSMMYIGGDSGLTGIPSLAIGSFDFMKDPRAYYYTLLFLTAGSLAVFYRMERSSLGILVRSLGGNDQLAEHLGVSALRYRMLVLCTGATFCGIAGAFYATYLHVMTPDLFGINAAIYLQVYAIVGGLASFWGPVVGVVFIGLLLRFLGGTGYVLPIYYGTLLVVFSTVAKDGILGLPETFRGLYRKFAGKKRFFSNA